MKYRYGIFICGLIILFFIGIGFSFSLPKWFPFSTDRSLDEWEEKILKGRVDYTIKTQKSESYLQAVSRSAASAVFYRVRERYSAQDYPMISWKWKVAKFPDKEKLRERKGIEKDDYAARVYVIFPSIIFFNSKALEYVWDETEAAESVRISPFSSNIRLIVAQSGRDESGKWIFEERNIVEDYEKAFGVKPSLRVGAIALMSDSDNTEDIVEAYFDEINIGYVEGAPEEQAPLFKLPDWLLGIKRENER